MKKIKVSNGVYWVGIPEAELFVLCGCPADCVKHLRKKGLMAPAEKDGVAYETGPNAILLSDVSLQKGSFCNLGEFAVLQMLYRQGMILPNHPNNTGVKPMLIGIPDQVKAQGEYIYRGNYGLVSEEEIMKTGTSAEDARDMMRVKIKFAMGAIRATEDLIDLKPAGPEPVELRNGVFIQRKGVNLYEFTYKNERVAVNLNLKEDEHYEASYSLECQKTRRDYFSVLHTGEGDGWDYDRPCMSSIVTYQGKIYLIDAGPNIISSLTALGISVDEIDGLFHTHAHDDHFNGLTVLMRSDHRLKYFATPLVRASVVKKLSALMSFEEKSFERYFDVRDLAFGEWSNFDGLEVMPALSPHPVETNILFFRTLWEDGYKTYAHFADVTSFRVLSAMVTDDPSKPGISREYFDAVKKIYLTPADLKKIDAGEGLIHGEAEDYRCDASCKIILSHTDTPLTGKQKMIGSSAAFGAADTLIPALHDYLSQSSLHYLREYFPAAPDYDLSMFANDPPVSFNPGTLLIKRGDASSYIYLILNGILEYIDDNKISRNTLSAGSMAGEATGLMGLASPGAYRAISHVDALKIPVSLYVEFLKRNRLDEDIARLLEARLFLQNTWLFGDMISDPLRSRIARVMSIDGYKTGERLPVGQKPELLLVKEGEIDMSVGGKTFETLKPGGFLGEDTVLFESRGYVKARAATDARVCRIPADALTNIPVVQWKLLETMEKRTKTMGLHFNLEWRRDMGVSVADMDQQHKKIFQMMAGLSRAGRKGPDFDALLKEFIETVQYHFHQEELLMEKYEYPDLAAQAGEHIKFIKDAAGLKNYSDAGEEQAFEDLRAKLTDWFIDHTLLEDRKYGAYLNARGLM